jgi:hypothetical protein
VKDDTHACITQTPATLTHLLHLVLAFSIQQPSVVMSNEEDDPFALFGSDDDDDDEAVGALSNEPTTRSLDNGILTNHNGTEQALLLFVQREMLHHQPSSSLEIDDIIMRCALVLKAIDKFCKERHWMMHVGDEKGAILKAVTTEAYRRWSSEDKNDGVFNVLEVGKLHHIATA